MTFVGTNYSEWSEAHLENLVKVELVEVAFPDTSAFYYLKQQFRCTMILHSGHSWHDQPFFFLYGGEERPSHRKANYYS